MPFKNRADAVAWNKRRYALNGEAMRVAAKRHYLSNREQIIARRKELRTSEQRERDTAAMRRYHARLRAEMIEAYGGECQCCAESEVLFLELDHTDSDGHKHRKMIGRGSGVTYRHLKKLGWPKESYQLLCANCNAGKARNGGACPHEN